MTRLVRILWLCAALVLAGPLAAQDSSTAGPAILVADRVFVTGEETLVAEGNVEVYQGLTRLTAQRIVYDRAARELRIDGPIRLNEGARILVLADAAQLSDDLREGLLTGARLVLDQQLQLAAVQIDRVDEGRYSQLYKTVVTSCRICNEGDVPLWQIRASRVIHDEEEQQLYFDDAQFRIGRVPVFYLPRLRLPDPTLDRASGFLIPRVRSTSQLGTGLQVPYFFRLGDHADLTLSPYLSSRTRTLEFRYRQAFRNGGLRFEGAITRDDILPDDLRGYLFGAAEFRLRRGFVLEFGVEYTSDNAYLIDYGKEDKDRLETELAITRTRRDEYIRAGIVHFNSLREGERDSNLPTIVFDSSYERRLFPQAVGGELRLGFYTHAQYRSSDEDEAGRDVGRATAEADWRRHWIFASGLRADWRAGLALDLFEIRQDDRFDSRETRVTPSAALGLRYPMTRQMGRAVQVLEPVVQLGWSDVSGGDVPGDQSGLVEFDEGNLLKLSRFPADDLREDGAELAYGLSFAHRAPEMQAAFTIGQVLREQADASFTDTSGLEGTSSDILLAGQIRTETGLALIARSLIDTDFDVAKAEFLGNWRVRRGRIGGTYLYLARDPAEDRDNSVSEVSLDGSWDVTPHWTASASWRYDLADTRAATAGVGLIYRNECVEVDLSLRRRYTDSTSVEPTTDFAFSVALRGFGATNGTERYVRSCEPSRPS